MGATADAEIETITNNRGIQMKVLRHVSQPRPREKAGIYFCVELRLSFTVHPNGG